MVTDNKAITNFRIASPAQMLPVIVPWNGPVKKRSGEHIGGNVRQLHPSDWALFLHNRRKFEELYGKAEIREDELLFVYELAEAIAKHDLLKLRNALKKLWKSDTLSRAVAASWGLGEYRPLRDLSMRFNNAIARAHPITYWSESDNRLVLAWMCSDMGTALFLLLLGKVSVSVLGECKGCHGVLIRERPNKDFCNANCRSRYYMRQLRERQKKSREKNGKESQRAKRSGR